ncbi:hypothetical protein [Parasitella parasitica]|uniref:Uncharacterized protein n=1 Tax=Parasitella parasitica TaxID=35722 RepID=A0A0B7MX07_9FUNG|nr:hypothetical protein [Parasitella parasitica]
MSDNNHLLPNENQHSQDFYTLVNQCTADSPSTTASPISPMTTIIQQNQSWPSSSQAIDQQQQYYHDMNQHPLPHPHPHQQQQHQLQDQYWTNTFQQGSSYPSMNQPQQQQFHGYYSEYFNPQIPTTEPGFYATQLPNDSFNAPMPIGRGSQFPLCSYSSAITPSSMIQHQSEDDIKKVPNHDNETSTSVPSPSETPFPSPVISGKRQRRQSTTDMAVLKQQKKRPQNDIKDTSKDEAALPTTNNEGNGESGTTSRRIDTQSNPTVDQLENELAFLRDECATILIMLDSLRNAFLADIPSTGVSLSMVNSNSISSTINFMVQDIRTLSPVSTTAIQHVHKSPATSSVDKRRKSKTIAPNPEREREMRIAYDDLMLQVRQLEKKVERLEGKSKNVCLDEPSINNSKKHEDQMANLNDDLHELQEHLDYSGGNDSGEEEVSSNCKKR